MKVGSETGISFNVINGEALCTRLKIYLKQAQILHAIVLLVYVEVSYKLIAVADKIVYGHPRVLETGYR